MGHCVCLNVPLYFKKSCNFVATIVGLLQQMVYVCGRMARIGRLEGCNGCNGVIIEHGKV
jgi:hypothetical protein